MTFFIDVLIQAGVYLVNFILAFVFFNFLSKNYLASYLNVKASRGKLILVRVLSFTGFYYKSGQIKQGLLHFKNREKIKDTYRVRKSDIVQEMGVNIISIDETTKKVLHIIHDPREGHDTEHFDSVLQRALYKPSLKDNPREIFMLALLIINIGATLFIGYLIYNLSATIPNVGVI